MIKLSGLWLNVKDNGEKYFAGNMGDARLFVYKNSYKKTDAEPDYILYADQRTRKEAPAPSIFDEDVPM